jgi:phosphoserine phosphatase
MSTRVILVRHGQSTYNAEKRYQGCCDESVLTEHGLLTAVQTGMLLKATEISAVYSSPLQRTQQTANAILNCLESGLELNCHAALKEIAMPAWEGLPFKYVRQYFAEDYQCWKERPHEFQMSLAQIENQTAKNGSVATLTKTAQNSAGSCFPVLDLYAQAQQFWKEILPRHRDETILVVSHGGTIRALIGTAIGMGSPSFHALQQSNCGVSVLNFPQGLQQPAQLEAMNVTQHVGEPLPKLKEGKLGLRLLLVSAEDHDRVDQLVHLLQPVKLDFCLSCDSSDLAEELLDRHSESAVHLRIAHSNFLETWHQTLKASPVRSDSLTTGLVIADPDMICRAISLTLNVPANSPVLCLKQGTLQTLHYPINHRPVLQTMNLSGTL